MFTTEGWKRRPDCAKQLWMRHTTRIPNDSYVDDAAASTRDLTHQSSIDSICRTDHGTDERSSLNQRIHASRQSIEMPDCATTSARTDREPSGSGAAPRVVRPMSAQPVRSARLRRSPGSAGASGVKGGPQAEPGHVARPAVVNAGAASEKTSTRPLKRILSRRNTRAFARRRPLVGEITELKRQNASCG
jgi:hypothetical protein